jgi:penicillin-binding protein 2
VEKYWDNPERPMLNRVTQGRYAPGSTYKLLVALTALEKGLITPATTATCHGHKNYYGRDFRCDATHGTVNLIQAIAQSCDIYFYDLGMRLDVDDLHATAVKYGLTELTGIDLPNELASRIPSREWKMRVKKEKWFAGETISIAIGQGANSVTPLGLARFYAMLATRGKLLTPHLLYGVRQDTGTQMDLVAPQPPRDTHLDAKIWQVLDEGLYEVVHSGTAAASAVPGLTMVGKTGTAQVRTFVDKRHYASLAKKFKDNALFAGYAPRENPQIAFVVVAENAGFGASSAAPIAKKLCQYWFFDRVKKPLPPPGAKLPDAYRLDAEPAAEGEAP